MVPGSPAAAGGSTAAWPLAGCWGCVLLPVVFCTVSLSLLKFSEQQIPSVSLGEVSEVPM